MQICLMVILFSDDDSSGTQKTPGRIHPEVTRNPIGRPDRSPSCCPSWTFGVAHPLHLGDRCTWRRRSRWVFLHLDVTPSPSNRHNIWSSKFWKGHPGCHPQFPLFMEQRPLLKHIQNLAKTCVPSHLSIDSALMRRLSPTCQGHIGSPKGCWLIWYNTHTYRIYSGFLSINYTKLS